jgi:hypothetical protein
MIKSYILQIVLPLVLPTVLYLIWRLLRRRGKVGEKISGPWSWLVLSGLGLVVLGFVVLGLAGGSPPGGTYKPPTLVDGEIVPGRSD